MRVWIIVESGNVDSAWRTKKAAAAHIADKKLRKTTVVLLLVRK